MTTETKTKAPSAWVAHLKKYAADKGIKYSEALKSADAKTGYVKSSKSRSSKQKVVVEVKVEPVAAIPEKKKRVSKKKSDTVPLVIVEDKPVVAAPVAAAPVVKTAAAKKTYKKTKAVSEPATPTV